MDSELKILFFIFVGIPVINILLWSLSKWKGPIGDLANVIYMFWRKIGRVIGVLIIIVIIFVALGNLGFIG